MSFCWSVKSGRWLCAFVTLLAVTLAGCDSPGYTPIGKIVAEPGPFDGKEVRLKGRASGTLSVLGVKAFVLRDETGEITVMTSGPLPAEKSEVAVKGVVRSVAIVGGSSLGLRVEESQRLN